MSNRVSFAVDADSISLKSIYKKDFLELQMRAISTANPNRNGTWFTEESLKDAVETCKNKPILGYFNNEGDFESHNGVWRKDLETGLEYWDTKEGEQILGIIRENDDIKVIKENDDLSWLCLSCALWTQYNFKQVKRLIKDAKRAKATGGVTKNISVEIDILEGEKQLDGVYRIDKFNLVGITILGTRQGKKVEPGIAGAALSIPEIMGTDFYTRQQNAIRAAYARLDNSDNGEREEEVLEMNEQEQQNFDSEEVQNLEAQSDSHENCADETAEEVCPECEQNPCVCAQRDNETCHSEEDGEACQMADDEQPKEGEKETCAEDNEADKEQCASVEQCAANEDGEEDDDEDKDSEDSEDSDPEDGEEDKDADKKDNYEENREARDITRLIEKVAYVSDGMVETMDYYNYLKDYEPEDAPNAEYVVSVLQRLYNYQLHIQGTLGTLLSKVAGEVTEEELTYETKMAGYENIDELEKKYEEEICKNEKLQEELETCEKEKCEYKARVDQYAHEKFLAEVNTLLSSNASKLDEQVAKEIYEACENGSLQTYEEVKTKVALSMFEAQQNFANIHTNVSFQSPVVSPDTKAAFEAKAEKSQKRDSWAIMREHYGKK